jgi:hypothetical protein
MPSSRVNAASARSGMLDIPFCCQAILKRVNFNIATLSDRDHTRQGLGEYFAETNQEAAVAAFRTTFVSLSRAVTRSSRSMGEVPHRR